MVKYNRYSVFLTMLTILMIAGLKSQPQYPENFYTYRYLFHSANDFMLMFTNLQIELAKAQDEKVWGFKEPPTIMNAPPVDDPHKLFEWRGGDWWYRKGYRYFCDLDNNGTMDYITIDDADKQNWLVYFNKNGNYQHQTKVGFSSLPSGVSRPYLGEYHDDGDGSSARTMILDVNGDSLLDVIWLNNVDESKVWYVAINKITEKKSFEVRRWNSPEAKVLPLTLGTHHNGGVCYLSQGMMDINGDKFPDYVISNRDGNSWEVYLGTGNGFKSRSIFPASPIKLPVYILFKGIQSINRNYLWYSSNNSTVELATTDINGDSLPDRVCFTDTAYWVSFNKGNVFEEWKKLQKPNTIHAIELGFLARATHRGLADPFSWVLSGKTILLDINGDHLKDIVTTGTEVKGYSVCLNEGQGRFAPAIPFLTELSDLGKETVTEITAFLADMNSDGFIDYIQADPNTDIWKLYYNTTGGDRRYQSLQTALNIREIQAKLQEGHEAFYREEYRLAQAAYLSADMLIDAFFNNQSAESAKATEAGGKPGLKGEFRTESLIRNVKRLGSVIQYHGPAMGDTTGGRKIPAGVRPYPVTSSPNQSYKAADKFPAKVSGPVNLSGVEFILPEDLAAAVKFFENDFCKDRIDKDSLEYLVLNQTVCDDPQSFVFYLPYIQDFVLPLCLGDVYLETGNYTAAEAEYIRASEYSCLNQNIETRLLWLKFAELYARWGNEAFKISYRANNEAALRDTAKTKYNRILQNSFPLFATAVATDSSQKDSIAALKRKTSKLSQDLKSSFNNKKSLIQSVSASPQKDLPATALQQAKNDLLDLRLLGGGPNTISPNAANPLVIAYQMEALMNVTKLDNHLNYLGYSEQFLPIWKYSYLASLARSFAQHAIQLEKEFVNFKVSAEGETYTNRQLLQSIQLNRFNQLVERYKAEQAAWQTAISKVNEKIAEIQRKAAKAQLDDIKSQSNKSFINGVINTASSTFSGVASGMALGPYGAVAGGAIGFASGLSSSISASKQIGNQLQLAKYQYQQALLAETAASLQVNVAQINQQICMLQRDMAALQLSFAHDNLSYLQNKQFNAELWYRLASSVRRLSRSYMDAAIELALLMEKAYKFETGRNINRIRLDYSRNDLSGLLAGDYLLQDIEAFEYDRAVYHQEKEIPVKHVISLAATRPLQFYDFLNTDTLMFATTLEEFSRAYPGAYNCRIKNVELIIEGLLPPGGVSGTLSNGVYSVARLPSGYIPDTSSLGLHNWQIVGEYGDYRDILKPQEMESMVLSKYAEREDRFIYSPPPEQLGIFENTGVATLWTLHLPRSFNNFDLNTISDVKLVITFTAQHDAQLADMVRKEYLDFRNTYPDSFATLTVYSARYQFPDAFYNFANAADMEKDTVELRFRLNPYYFPLNEYEFQTAEVYLAFFPPDSLHNHTITASLGLKTENGEISASASTDSSKNGIMTFTANTFKGKNPLSEWVVRIPKANFEVWKLAHLYDVWLCLNYTSKVKTPQ